ncbi:MAG TPA: efflux RND transporter periplasmic adaptor subunit [Candidatus Paceibacterota bacterium]|nr:efflux RND transporter periplasmic adaptor subunit [Candidatus Paceibacterota bacterium]
MPEENKNSESVGEIKVPIYRRPIFRNIIIGAIILVIAIGFIYWFSNRNKISTDNATVSAPEIALSADTPGILRELYVREGDIVTPNQAVARVGDQLIKTNVGGVVVKTTDTIGTLFNPGQAVVTMVNPNDLRVLANVDENKGLVRISAGNRVVFTVDAFGSRKFEGTVESVIPSAVESQVVFNVSDKRETRQFTVKIKYDVDAYPEILNGMSAKVTIYTK